MSQPTVTYHSLRSLGSKASLEFWPKRNAGVMLFYPGTMLCPRQYRPLLAALYEAGFAVAALHLTGHGRNSHWTGFTFADLLRDGLAAEQWLRQEGFNAIAVSGHSQGGILTLAHAAASQGLTAAFPITGTLPQSDDAVDLTRFRRWKNRRREITANINALARRLPRLALPLPAYLSIRRITSGARRIVYDRKHSRLTYPLAFLASLFSANVSEEMHCPLYFFSAVNDALFTPANTKATFETLRAPVKKLLWLPGGGHLAAMNPPLCRFIARHAAAVCAGQGLPLQMEATQARGGAHYGL
ncbi:MAG: esterase [Desulfovibrio sp. MES5]|uniref:alpha/beta hydrolase n=1 Tax=Desulfovibrio sp. MES5 TaxID=1899016 RepID=UPI000B9D26F1|nr:alpha/beta fold hydrolase [Desulfovibrio sp. MES5]OXS28005.1 MAG: esterase [Desulfovibrio sp. MES5]